MKKFGVLVFKNLSKNRAMWKTSIRDIAPFVQRWSKNRPEDIERVTEIESSFTCCTNFIDGVIHAWWHNDKLHIYDGWTRFCAGFSHSANLNILLHVHYTSDETVIIDHFQKLNKAVSVPSLYLEEQCPQRRLFLETLANKLIKRYPKFISNAARPRKPNINRDSLIELMDTSLPRSCLNESVDCVMDTLQSVNDTAISKAKAEGRDLHEKVVHYGCILFCLSSDELCAHYTQLQYGDQDSCPLIRL